MNHHPGIVSESDFDEVKKKLLHNRGTLFAAEAGKRYIYSRKYTFSLRIRCVQAYNLILENDGEMIDTFSENLLHAKQVILHAMGYKSEIAGLGFRSMAAYYAISSIDEAEAYMQEPTLDSI